MPELMRMVEEMISAIHGELRPAAIDLSSG